MYFITDKKNIIFTAQSSDFMQFLFCPDTSHRIMRRTQYHKLIGRIHDPGFQVCKIHGISSAMANKWIYHNPSSGCLYCLPEGIVYRSLYYYSVTRLSEFTDSYSQGCHNTRCYQYIIACRTPSISF